MFDSLVGGGGVALLYNVRSIGRAVGRTAVARSGRRTISRLYFGRAVGSSVVGWKVTRSVWW